MSSPVTGNIDSVAVREPVEAVYLGDAVHASFDGYHIWLKTADGRPIKESPAKVDDHGMDATRYACAYADRLGLVVVKAY